MYIFFVWVYGLFFVCGCVCGMSGCGWGWSAWRVGGGGGGVFGVYCLDFIYEACVSCVVGGSLGEGMGELLYFIYFYFQIIK